MRGPHTDQSRIRLTAGPRGEDPEGSPSIPPRPPSMPGALKGVDSVSVSEDATTDHASSPTKRRARGRMSSPPSRAGRWGLEGPGHRAQTGAGNAGPRASAARARLPAMRNMHAHTHDQL